MIEWWNSMDLAGQIFALIAIPSTLVLVVQTVLLLFGMGDDDVETEGIDLNGNGVGDTPGDGGGDGMALFSLRGIMAMAAVGGWSSLFAQLYNKILQHGAARDVAVVLYHSSEDGQLSHKDDHSRASRDRCVKQIPRKEHRRT